MDDDYDHDDRIYAVQYSQVTSVLVLVFIAHKNKRGIIIYSQAKTPMVSVSRETMLRDRSI